jgi:hypothetical protein
MKKHIEGLQSYVNTLAFGSETKPGHWKCPIKNGDEVDDCSFTDMQAKDIEENLGALLKRLLFWKNHAGRLARCYKKYDMDIDDVAPT